MLRTGGELNFSIFAPVLASVAWRSNAEPEAENVPADALLVGVIETYASAGRLPGAKVNVASPEVTLPPAAALINTEPAGGPRALPGSAAGSPGPGVALWRVVAPSDAGGRTLLWAPVPGELPLVCDAPLAVPPELAARLGPESLPATAAGPLLDVCAPASDATGVLPLETPVTASGSPVADEVAGLLATAVVGALAGAAVEVLVAPAAGASFAPGAALTVALDGAGCVP
jgi:hypothetical protein